MELLGPWCPKTHQRGPVAVAVAVAVAVPAVVAVAVAVAVAVDLAVDVAIAEGLLCPAFPEEMKNDDIAQPVWLVFPLHFCQKVWTKRGGGNSPRIFSL